MRSLLPDDGATASRACRCIFFGVVTGADGAPALGLLIEPRFGDLMLLLLRSFLVLVFDESSCLRADVAG